jgi:glycosyltransferase involved in cell wall biosynthesis
MPAATRSRVILTGASRGLGHPTTQGHLKVASTAQGQAPTTRGVVLGMTLYNNARHLPEAIESLLAQTHCDFTLILLDDASADETESVARAYAAKDSRVRYFRHDSRQAMIATWRDVVEIARRECPDAEYFAWVSDHDRWHSRWLERLLAELDADRGAVIAYPITRRIGQTGVELDKGPRLFDTTGCADLRARWRHMCHAAVGAGDMVYGLMRIDALMKAGIFRRVLRPDRLLIAELILFGGVRQVPEALWFRRESNGASVDRQRHTLVLAGDEPKRFHTPPWFQHSVMLWEQYATPEPPPLPISRTAWRGMLLRYSLTYGWKHFRKTEASHAVGRGIDNAIWVKKITKHHWHHAVYNTLVGARAAWGRTRRLARRGLYEVLMLTHRLGLRGRGKAQTR